MKTINRVLIYLFVLGLLLCSCASPYESYLLSPMHVLEDSANYDVVWEKDNYWTDSNERMPKIVGAPNKIILEGRIDGKSDLFITVFDSVTGEVIWEKFVWGNMPGSILVHDNTLFRGTLGASFAQSFDLSTGELLWETKLPKAHSTSIMYYADDKLFVFTSDNMFFTLDKTGEILNTSHEDFYTFFIADGISYKMNFSAITAVDHSSEKEIWRLDIEKSFREAPIFDDGTIFLRTRFIPNYIYSIDQVTGAINWKVFDQDVLSNLYVTDEKVYFLSYSSELVSLDRYSGEEISREKFSPAFDLDEPSGGYFVTEDPINDILVISFGDNTQLLALKILTP